MKKEYSDFISDCFIPNMKKLGYTETFIDKDIFKLNYHDKGCIIFDIKNKYAQILIKVENPGALISFKHLALLSDNAFEKEKLKNASDAFFYDNFYEFEGLLNYAFLTLKQRGDFIFSEEGYSLLKDKIEEKKQAARKEFDEHRSNKNLQSKIYDFVKASEEWKKSIRFTEECYHKLSV